MCFTKSNNLYFVCRNTKMKKFDYVCVPFILNWKNRNQNVYNSDSKNEYRNIYLFHDASKLIFNIFSFIYCSTLQIKLRSYIHRGKFIFHSEDQHYLIVTSEQTHRSPNYVGKKMVSFLTHLMYKECSIERMDHCTLAR